MSYTVPTVAYKMASHLKIQFIHQMASNNNSLPEMNIDTVCRVPKMKATIYLFNYTYLY